MAGPPRDEAKSRAGFAATGIVNFSMPQSSNASCFS